MNNCKYYLTPKCIKFLDNLDASCNGTYFFDGQGHSLPICECRVRKESGDALE